MLALSCAMPAATNAGNATNAARTKINARIFDFEGMAGHSLVL